MEGSSPGENLGAATERRDLSGDSLGQHCQLCWVSPTLWKLSQGEPTTHGHPLHTVRAQTETEPETSLHIPELSRNLIHHLSQVSGKTVNVCRVGVGETVCYRDGLGLEKLGQMVAVSFKKEQRLRVLELGEEGPGSGVRPRPGAKRPQSEQLTHKCTLKRRPCEAGNYINNELKSSRPGSS